MGQNREDLSAIQGIIVAREALTGWVETKAIGAPNAKIWAKCLDGRFLQDLVDELIASSLDILEILEGLPRA
ncbi:hypothetical protein C343_01511 [Cryptococcus neoformans C23]|nr:hypothetical protein C347_01580 [Cryptococcus neoformans var. grubii AD2-60a]OWZ46281.1 hypothetical protein C343_01511 [Cryptococcus neoformans var. grubii C23]OWZ55402.1 hypothetical protein C368_02341 [Cryptococcus neoformans var. grubii 125.91]OXC86190.1 hypothetical protein C344_01487 [Cryptococcus neoformans var. grubii AD1-7a]OXG34971.1 hypothetical protein C359_06429 [Cryptococcus neoformans var. grubii Bt120]OXG37790.1 hypothetical protein C360_01546 [Cryptococcus neoformans var. g